MDNIKRTIEARPEKTEQAKEAVDLMRYDLPRVCRIPYVPGRKIHYSFEERHIGIIVRIKRRLACLFHHN